MTETVSIPAIKQYLQAAESLGVATSKLLSSLDIDANILADNNQRISLALFEQLIAALLEKSDHPCFGLYASDFVNTTTYASLGLISISAQSLKDSIELVPTYESLVGDMGTTDVIELNEGYLLRWHCKLHNPEVKRHVVEAVLSSWYRYGKNIVGLRGKMIEVQFQHQAYQQDDLAYQNIFACPVRFNADFNGLHLPGELMEQSLPQANQMLQASLIQHADSLLGQLDQKRSTTDRVIACIEQHMQDQQLSKAMVADLLGTSARTLQRRLESEGVSFQQLLDQLRLKKAQFLLMQDSTMEEITEQLGFTEPRSFFRRFKQWTGMTAGEFRQKNRDKHL